MVTVAIALGSNLGDSKAHLEFACGQLERLISDLRVSSFRNTAPVGVPGPQPDFLNAAAVGDTELDAPGLLAALLGIEQMRGRERPHPNAPRTLDLDLILFGDEIVNQAGMNVPHPRFRERRFVLEPLAEIAPGLKDPVTGRTVAELWAAISSGNPAARPT
jgi:2-amino-4-hydroxy-6-hydroxymethyldihydropteridine diphosphokinase